ncbi:MAG: MaoC family dehydratase N-terminal domain-containing protein [Actinomycetota bacterium]|nr:MaoC family dehydratase N-terminal domain-containing protein [Actinomycetota bacterium]
MALDSSFVGRSYPRAATYVVGREKIREFADAIGDEDPVYRDPNAARAAGHPDVIAPPTFTMLLSLRSQQALVSDPELGLDYSRVVHGDQSFTHHRPVRAGDTLSADLHVDSIRFAAGNDMITVRCEITDADGAPVTTARSMLVVRGEGAR